DNDMDNDINDESYDTGFGLGYPKKVDDDVLTVRGYERIPANQIPSEHYVPSLVASAIKATIDEKYGGVDPNTEIMENRPIHQSNTESYIPVDEHTSILVT
ncbi:MAG: hypothetical protein KAI18_02710, partial [Candidatus Aenigmarchaeota archaeon]|nr:hypothetical protein [Candidatus Aenigmarchaeota archaeon]